MLSRRRLLVSVLADWQYSLDDGERLVPTIPAIMRSAMMSGFGTISLEELTVVHIAEFQQKLLQEIYSLLKTDT